MKKFFSLFIIVVLNLLFIPLLIVGAVIILFTPLYAQEKVSPFIRPSLVSLQAPEQPAKLINFKGSINKNKVLLQWTVKENENADQFVVEKSFDGKNFAMAALVFGTDKSETENYQFYEKAINKKVSYRIKLISKKQETEYSSVIEISYDSKTSEK